jgi:hypothetical protein
MAYEWRNVSRKKVSMFMNTVNPPITSRRNVVYMNPRLGKIKEVVSKVVKLSYFDSPDSYRGNMTII